MKSHICKGQVLLDVRELRRQIKELKQPMLNSTGNSDEYINKVNDMLKAINQSVDLCEESASKMKSIVKLSDGRVVNADDSVVDAILAENDN